MREQRALTDSLHDLFAQISDEPARHIDAMIIPAVATGVGKLTKAAFYNKLLVDVLVEELKKEYALPATLYLQVRRWENPNRWPETQTAMASAVAKAVSTWAQSEHKSAESEWLSLTGVAAGSCVILLLMASGLSVAFLSDLMPLVQRPSLLLFLSWISTAVGLVSMFKAIVSFFPADFNPYLQIGAGFVTMLLCGPLTRANRQFDDILKAAPDVQG
jgi:hypothetical protein